MRLPIKSHWVIGIIVACLITACSSVDVKPDTTYSVQARQKFYELEQWSFEGRLAITGQSDSWSANMNWIHTPAQENMKLSGPLGQGATHIRLTKEQVTIDRGDGNPQTSVQPEEFVNQQVGILVPLQSLRYWVVGLPEPSQEFIETIDGFNQEGWLVSYKEMQATNGELMPRKISVSNSQAKLKLIVDQWIFNNAIKN
ncbi:MAG: outer membrane lipoprotein LolB [Methylococcaceae bacterium]|nr:outer membrane lipoprotein LolB [Methylococcaceae bacterium]